MRTEKTPISKDNIKSDLLTLPFQKIQERIMLRTESFYLIFINK